MDIVMPGMDGIETVKALMSEDPAAKIIMCSALGQQQMVIEALQAGAKDFIVKPFQPVIIAETVKKVLVS
jgi:two-component system chemotaxis response regulator CheY